MCGEGLKISLPTNTFPEKIKQFAYKYVSYNQPKKLRQPIKDKKSPASICHSAYVLTKLSNYVCNG